MAVKDSRPMPLGNPADYPLGSVESRAAARAIVEAMDAQPLTSEEIQNLTPAQRRERLIKLLKKGAKRIEMGCKPMPHGEGVARLINVLRESAAKL
jgi:hypothetical protein